MRNNNTLNRSLQAIIVGVVLLLFVVSLFIDNTKLAWVIIGLLFVDALCLTVRRGKCWWKGKQSKIALRERFLTFLASLMFLFLITGTALFMQAFIYESKSATNVNEVPFQFLNAEYLLRSLACSLQLFTGSIDSNVLDGIKEHQYLKGFISLQTILSFCCTIAVLLSLAYARVSAYYKLHRKTKIDPNHNHLYIFFGMNDPSRLLAKDIRKKEGDRAVIVFVENRMKNDDDQSGWGNIVGMITHRRQTFLDANKLGARVTFTELHLCDISEDILEDDNADILREINLIKLCDLIGKLKSIQDAQLHLFFLSENEDENIRALAVLAHDSTIQKLAHDSTKQKTQNIKKPRFYCHARRNDLNRTIEEIGLKREIDVRIIDSSFLAVEQLKDDENNHPVHFVDIDEHNPTTIKSKFNSLIVGFEEVGRDALKFLYEFGAFIDSKATPDDERRSPFHCIAIDKRMDEIRGTFVNFTPAVMAQRNNDESESPLVELKTCDCLSSDFYENILNTDFCKGLNYVVIAVGDDELGMTLALNILNHVRRVRPNLHRLRIYIRSYRSDKEAYMQQIATYYNDGYNKGVNNQSFKNDAIIQLFGQSKEIYTYERVIKEELIQKGQEFQKSYDQLRGESTLWATRREKEPKDTLDSIRSLRRKKLQNLNNARHAYTKIYLLKKAMCLIMGANYDWNDFIKRYFDEEDRPLREGSYDNIKYPLLTKKENEIILNLARLEHIRWNASHEMLGYTGPHATTKDLHTCDERTREHNCLRPWHELDKESKAASSSNWQADYKQFDFSVVDNSIWLNKDKLLAQ
ncbi:MAG: hypothetical protein IKT00_12045 [Prevotella sp.]|nr:hypothetical protein [Prevotella sp.]